MARPTFADKVDRQTQAGARINLVVADDINQLKAAIIALYDMFETVTVRTCVAISSADFTGPYYQNALLVDLTPDIDFRVFTNGGSGVLLYSGDGFVYDSALGKLTMEPSDYNIEIYTPVTEL